MDNKSQLLIIQAIIDSNRQDYGEKMKRKDYKLDELMELVENVINHIQISTFSLDKMN